MPTHMPIAVWGSLGLGHGSVSGSDGSALAAVAKGSLSVGHAVLEYRSSDVGPFIGAGSGVRDRAVLGGVRTAGHRLFTSVAIGVAQASGYHQCDQCGVTDVAPPVGVAAYDITAHANSEVLGVAASLSGVAGPARVRYAALTVGLELGWFSR